MNSVTATNALFRLAGQAKSAFDLPGTPEWLDKVILCLLVLLGVFVASFIIRLAFNRLIRLSPKKETVLTLACLCCRILLWLVYFTVCMSILEVDFVPLLACLGVGGISMGVALKDPINSLIAGLTLIVGEVFAIGDVISVAGVEGEVREITIRYTKIKTEDALVYVPNLSILNSVVTLKKSPSKGFN